jgi:hypothetical protein
VLSQNPRSDYSFCVAKSISLLVAGPVRAQLLANRAPSSPTSLGSTYDWQHWDDFIRLHPRDDSARAAPSPPFEHLTNFDRKAAKQKQEKRIMMMMMKMFHGSVAQVLLLAFSSSLLAMVDVNAQTSGNPICEVWYVAWVARPVV